MKKFELTENFKMHFGKKLFQIRALVDLECGIKTGELGGYVEKEENLDQSGNAWVYDDAQVYGDAQVFGDAWVYGDAEVFGDARVYGDAEVSGNAQVSGDAQVFGDAWVFGDARVFGNADILQITGLGTCNRTTTAFRTKNGVRVKCGCFYGNVEQFREQVKRTREGKVQAEYLKFAELIEIYFEEVKANE